MGHADFLLTFSPKIYLCQKDVDKWLDIHETDRDKHEKKTGISFELYNEDIHSRFTESQKEKKLNKKKLEVCILNVISVAIKQDNKLTENKFFPFHFR